MAYTYLLDLYKQIDIRLAEARQAAAYEDGPAETAMYNRGRTDLLEEFETFLAENLNDKLPKRIRKRLTRSD